MYSFEIKQYIAERNNVLTNDEYRHVSDIDRNPQISSIKYNPFDNSYEMSTDDGYYFRFDVRS